MSIIHPDAEPLQLIFDPGSLDVFMDSLAKVSLGVLDTVDLVLPKLFELKPDQN